MIVFGRKTLGAARLGAVATTLALAAPALAAIDGLPVDLRSDAWADLGAGGRDVTVNGGTATCVVADTMPADVTLGGPVMLLSNTYSFRPKPASNHVYCRAFNGAARVAAPASDAATGAAGAAGAAAVYGPDAIGAPPTKPPLLNGYQDSAGNVRPVAPATPLPAADKNNASYTSGGLYIASGSLVGTNAPPGMPSDAAPRGIGWICDSTMPSASVATVTLANGGTHKIVVYPNSDADRGYAAVSVTAVTGCTFQSLY